MTIVVLDRPDDLNGLVDFDSPFRIHPYGRLEKYLPDTYAPDVVFTPGQTPDVEIESVHPWKPWMGASGQQGYSGPIMHASEQLAGGMAREVLATPGLYCVVEVRDEDGTYPDGDPVGWALVYIPD